MTVLDYCFDLGENSCRAFLFTGQINTMPFWKEKSVHYFYNPHGVGPLNVYREGEQNVAGLFRAKTKADLATLLLAWSACDGVERGYSLRTFGVGLETENNLAGTVAGQRPLSPFYSFHQSTAAYSFAVHTTIIQGISSFSFALRVFSW